MTRLSRWFRARSCRHCGRFVSWRAHHFKTIGWICPACNFVFTAASEAEEEG